VARKYIDIKEFREEGYLQELNRQFLHPLGLALEVQVDEDTEKERLGGVWDYRDDPEGIIFAEGVLNPDKTARVEEQWEERTAARAALLGSTIQPVPRK